MHRRAVLKWLSACLALVNAAIVAIPGVSFVFAAVRRRGGRSSVVQRVARLDDLHPRVPVEATIVGSKRDAWCVFDEQTIGRVWLIRQSASDVPPADTVVEAFSAVCPHLACVVGIDHDRQRFHCPCHEAAFAFDGKRVPAAELGHSNPSPRDLDPLPCQIVHDAQDDTWWVEVTYLRFRPGVARRIPEST